MATPNGPRIYTDGRTWTLAGWYGLDLPLLAPNELKRRAHDTAGSMGEPDRTAAAELVEACVFEYEVVLGKDVISWLLGVVIHTDPEHAKRLADHSDSAVQAFYGALGTACPDLGTDRVVAHE
jgi:hypothetical protein